MRKKILSVLIILLLLAVAGLGFLACEPKELKTPARVSVNRKGVVSWLEVKEAKGYELRINNEIVPCSTTSFNLLEMENLPSDRQFTVRVRAVKGKKQSEWSDMVVYTHTPTEISAPDLKVANGKLTWTANAQAQKVIVTVNGVQTELSAAASQYDISALQQDAVISVQFIGDGVYMLDSAKASVVYNVASGKFSLAAPQNVRMDGYVLTFDAVPGADIYYLLDVANNLTAITTNSSDRTNKYLVKSVWAVNTSGEFEDSEIVDVTYYAEGSGTEEDPFLIGTPSELRFVEFYENQNQSKYYKFKNDIALPSYVPNDEEDYNNFYNLGSLSGVIDGDGHKLANSVVYFSDGYSSLFDSVTPSGVIKNLVIDNANLRTWTSITNDGVMHEKGGECAILAYTNRGTLDNITVINSYIYSAKDGAAALVSINKGTIINCNIESSTSIYGANEAGGIAIFNSGAISNCINRAEISGATTVGGIVGRNNGTVFQCGNVGKITAATYGGGIVGYNFNIFDEELLFESTVSQCYNYGEINVVSCGGGIVGKNGGDGINEVGKPSLANAGIFSCYNTGAINGANSIGGIVGDNYGYHDVETDLGVVNCYNSGEITVDINRLMSTRVYLSLEDCSWGADAGAAIYMYYWGTAGGVDWPGVRMTAIEINNTTYYYADMNINAEQLSGVLFARWNPEAVGIGNPWNKSNDFVGRRTTGELLFKIDTDWRDSTTDSSEELVNNTHSAGGIAGHSNMINDCYYLVANVEGNELAAGVAQGEQTNKIFIGGTEVGSNACQIDSSALATFASTLNSYADVWENSDNGPILKWQRRG